MHSRSRASWVVVATLLAVGCGNERTQPLGVRVRINELSSTNHVYRDANGNTDDWIELYNLDLDAVNLGGYYISDDVDTRFKQVLPNEAEISGRGVLLLWADAQPEQGPLHLNFKLSAQGEGVWLSNRDGYVLDSVEFRTVPSNDAGTEETTFGRFPDGTGEFQWCSVSSPDEVNGERCSGETP